MDTGRPKALPDNYYLTNFHALASFVVETYHDLLSPEEHCWYEQLSTSAESAQRLYIRLVTRKGSVFRCSGLKYDEIADLQDASHTLAGRGLVDIDPPEQIDALVREFTKPELAKYLDLPGTASISRVAMVAKLLDAPEEERRRTVQILQQSDRWVTITGHQHWTVFNLCFFGNLYQDSSEFVLRDLGTLSYEAYQIQSLSRPFQTRPQIDAHLRYYECSALLDTIDTKNAQQLCELVQKLPDTIEGDRHLKRRQDRFRNQIARQLERLGKIDEALALYQSSERPPARERRVRILIKRERYNEAQALCLEMLNEPYSESETQLAQRLQGKLNKLLDLPIKPVKRYRPETTQLTLQPTGERVEHAARQFYTRLGHCYYVENSLVNAVLGLLIWDVIFHPMPGAFFNPFQAAPNDFYTPSFGSARAQLLTDRFELLDNRLRFSACIMEGFTKHHGKCNPLVRWDYLTPELLSMALQRIPIEHWRVLFKRIMRDLRENTSGFPDLILFPNAGHYEFIEIKGPGDTLQENQRRWMKYFSDHRIPGRVVNVRWAQQSGCPKNR